MTTFSADDLTVTYGTNTALAKVSITLERGQVHGVIGGDGAGKSTLLKVLAGLDVGQTGAIHLPPANRIGYVPSTGGIFGDLTVDENMEFVASAYDLGGWEARASMLLERAAIGRFGKRVAKQMSGGERRKLAGCLALLHEPELLVLDEVTTGVDPVSRMELWRLVTGSAAGGAAVVVATTYLDEAERMASVLLLDRGQVRASGPPAEIVSTTHGSVVILDAPTDPSRAWRSGRRWRQWSADEIENHAAVPGEWAELGLEDAAIIRELEAGDTIGEEPTVLTTSPATTTPRLGKPPIIARGVSKTFGYFTAVDNIDLDLDSGEIVGLLGANGAGKTTVIKMVLGLLLPTHGDIRLFGERASREQRRNIGYVPQNLGLYGDLTAHENLEFRAEIFGSAVDDDGSSNGRLLAEEPLGVQRHFAFRAATQHHPDLLILDEPTSGVSPLARSRLWDMIHARADDGVGVLVSTHYMDEAVQADRLIVLSNGRLVASGTVDDVLSDRTVMEIEADNWASAFAAVDRPGRSLRLAGRTVRVLGIDDDQLRSELQHAGVTAEIRTSPATLEEVLIELDTIEHASL